ncbi:MAG: hypothetical protein NTW32_22635 [Chloroflexi bacterium]|nr:hypothetical protein [Chloroflexota bacterium]
MLTALRQTMTVPADGNIKIYLPDLKPGSKAEVIVLVEENARQHRHMTGSDLLASGVVGLWAKRKDLGDSLEFARQLRQNAEHRERGS